MAAVSVALILLRHIAGSLALIAGIFVWRHAPRPLGWLLGPIPLGLWLAGEVVLRSSSLALAAPLTPVAAALEISAALVGMWLAMWAETSRTGHELRRVLQRFEEQDRALESAGHGGPFRTRGRLADLFD